MTTTTEAVATAEAATETDTGTRIVDGLNLPVAGRWDIDRDHTNVEFRVRHGLTRLRGRFNSFDGSVDIASEPQASSVEITIDATSIDTDQEQRDGHLRSADFFDVENHPTWTFRSTTLRDLGDDGLVLDGDLTVRGTTRPVSLVVDYLGVLPSDPWGMTRASFSAHTKVNREDFGVSWNDLIDGKIPFIGRTVTIEIEAELIYRGSDSE